MLLAMAEDVRVVIIKIADRLHNMQTLEHLPAERRAAIARETMDIYAPLAGRLGIWQMRWQLEDLAFRFLDPEGYRLVAAMVASRRQERERFVRGVATELGTGARGGGHRPPTSRAASSTCARSTTRSAATRRRGRASTRSTISSQMRVLVPEVANCYAALGIIHQLWRPDPRLLRRLHREPEGVALPVAAHLRDGARDARLRGADPHARDARRRRVRRRRPLALQGEEPRSRRDERDEERMSWLRHLVEWQRESSGPEDFLESVKTDVFRDSGLRLHPARGTSGCSRPESTPIDFAFRIHTDLGLHCSGATLNGHVVPLNTTLANGDVVHILRGRGERGPSREWLNPALGYIGSSNARQKVRQWFRRQQRHENIRRGSEQLELEQRRLGLSSVPADLVAQLGFESADEMLEAIGYGGVSSELLAQTLVEHVAPSHPAQPSTRRRPGRPRLRHRRPPGDARRLLPAAPPRSDRRLRDPIRAASPCTGTAAERWRGARSRSATSNATGSPRPCATPAASRCMRGTAWDSSATSARSRPRPASTWSRCGRRSRTTARRSSTSGSRPGGDAEFAQLLQQLDSVRGVVSVRRADAS